MKNVLVAEDDDEVREILEALLSGAGYRPIAAQDGLEAVDWLTRLPIDLIIVDILMPRLDGPELIERARKNQHWAHIPILLLSAFANFRDYRHLAVDAVQVKPFEVHELLREVERLIGPADPSLSSAESDQS